MEWIQQGSRGDDVLDVQNRLKERGFDPGPIDGIFGSKTEEAVRGFQEKHGLQVDGIVGPETGGALGMLGADGTVPTDAEQAERLKAMKARMDDMAEQEEQKKAAEKQREAIDALRKKEHEERQAAAEKQADAVEAVTDAVKSTGDKVEETKVGGSLWSRITGRNRKRDR